MDTTRRGVLGTVVAGAAALSLVVGTAAPALAQPEPQSNPVYVDEWAASTEALAGVPGQIASGNLDGAVRVLQRLLDDEPGQVVASADDADLFTGVRDRVHAVLLSNPALLARYRDAEGIKAEHTLEEPDGPARVERSWLLTPAGLEAALRLAQGHIEGARFNAAWLTLRQLDAHPDRKSGPLAKDAAALLATAARYLPRAEVTEMAQRWAREAGAPAPNGDAARWPAAALRRGVSPLDPGADVSLDGMVAKSLWSVQLGTPLQPPPSSGGRLQMSTVVPRNSVYLWILPAFDGDTVYINDGATVSAWDRFTLTKRWAVTPTAEAKSEADAALALAQARRSRGGGRLRGASVEDPTTATIAGRHVIAVTGLALDGRRDGEGVHALDAQTGEVRWSVVVSDLDPALSGASVRGPVHVHEGTVVVAARKVSGAQRLASFYLVGLDVSDGSLKWRRLVGSAGALPYGPLASLIDGAAVEDGIVYRADHLGVMGAYEVATGRPVWVRRSDARGWGMNAEGARPWEVNAPIIDNGSLVTLSPDRREIVRIDRTTGRVLGRRSAADFSTPGPAYLVRVGDTLAAVGESRIAMAPLATFENPDTPITQATRITEPGIRGRVAVAGSRLIIPTAGGVAVLDATDPSGRLQALALENPGNVLPLPSQLLVVDDSRVHSYLLWDEAQRVLTDRMRQDPSDPTPAVTFAELAYRAGRPSQILGAVDSAVQAIEGGGKAGGGAAADTEAARRRLFDAILGMVNASQEPGALTDIPGAPAKLADAQLIASLTDRLGRLASTADERVSFLLARGRSQELQSDPGGAVETYQRILADQALAASTWTGPQVSLRGELEATWRLERLVQEHGPAVYAVHEAQAAGELAALGDAASPEALEALARRYPVAAATPRMWLRIAEANELRGQTQAVSSALEAGLRAARRRPDVDATVIGGLAGRLVRLLEQRGQFAGAVQVLRQMREQFPQVALTDTSGPVATDEALAALTERAAAASRWPRIGQISGESVQAMQGWILLRPLIREITGTSARCLVMESGEEVAIWSCRAGAGDDCDGDLVKTWSTSNASQTVDLLMADGDWVYLFVTVPTGGVALKVQASTGIVQWSTEPFPTLFGKAEAPPPPDGGGIQTMQTPLDGLVPVNDLIVRMDGRTVALVERTGRAAAFDSQTGQLLWTIRAPVTRVYDVELRAGVLAIGGDQDAPGEAAGASGPAPTILALDARTGQISQRIVSTGGTVRWVALAEDGAGGAGISLLAGLERGLVSFDLSRGRANWALDDAAIAMSQQAWIVGDRMLVIGADPPVRTMWPVSVREGRLGPQQAAIPSDHLDEGQPIYAARVRGPRGNDAIAFSTIRGLSVVSLTGELLGVDALGGLDALLAPQPAEGVMVTAETVASQRDPDGQMTFNLHVLDAGTARIVQTRSIVLGARPRRMALLDGRIALTAGGSTVVLRAPAPAKQP